MAEFRLGRLKFNWRGDWAISTAYVIDDLVKLGGNTYACTTNHTSVGSTSTWFATDLSKWSLHTDGIRNRGTFAINTYYLLNDVFKYGNKQYRVTTGFSTSFFTTVGAASTNFEEYISGKLPLFFSLPYRNKKSRANILYNSSAACLSAR